MLTLRQLRYLDALARHGNFVRAAEECAISQPALSMQIRELENELGAELVARRHGVTVLTEAGAEVARRASSILSATHDLAPQREVAQRNFAAGSHSDIGTVCAARALAGASLHPSRSVPRFARNTNRDSGERACTRNVGRASPGATA